MSKKKRKTRNKNEQFVEKKGGGNKKLLAIAGSSIAIAVAVLVYSFMPASTVSSSGGKTGRTNVGAIAYDENIEMTDIESELSDGKIVISLDDVKQYKMVSFSYPKNKVDTGFGEQPLPIMAYITPKGDLVTAVAMCEPCKSIKFHYETDNTLTCNACNTKWDIETIEGFSGQCTDYPPDEVKNTIKNGKIFIDESEVSGWETRV